MLLALIILPLSACKEIAPVLDRVESAIKNPNEAAETGSGSHEEQTSSGSISSQQMVEAIKQALTQGVDDSIQLLASLGGFNVGQRYHIPLPQQLNQPASLLRKIGQGQKVDEFESRLNLAARQAVKKASPVFTQAIKSMSVQDALGIMQGEDNAATLYFRNKTEVSLRRLFLPIISKATEQTGLISAYKSIDSTIKNVAPSLRSYTVNIDEYVLDNSMDALFHRIAIEEKLIREQPVKRTTDLMKRVFGYFS